MAAIEIDDNGICVSAELLGELLDLPPAQIQALMAAGEITSRHERGVDEDAGRHRLTFVYRDRRARLTVDGAGRIFKRSRASGATTPDVSLGHVSAALEARKSEAACPGQRGQEEGRPGMTMQSAEPPLARRTVGEIAATLPGATAVFRCYGIDTCYGTETPLADAAASRGLDPVGLDQELTRLAAREVAASAPTETTALIEHIVARYHAAHREELSELVKLARRVENVHANHPKAPHGLGDLLHQLLSELEVHMKKEELVLFPALRRGATTTVSGPVADILARMREDHEDHEEDLARIEALTCGLSLPEGACRSWQALYLGTLKLVRDLDEHMRLENDVLFPRFETSGHAT